MTSKSNGVFRILDGRGCKGFMPPLTFRSWPAEDYKIVVDAVVRLILPIRYGVYV